MPENNAPHGVRNFFTNEDPARATNNTGSYGIINDSIDSTMIVDGITERGAGLGKLGSSMPSPLARMFLFSAALREVNDIEGKYPGDGHNGSLTEDGEYEPTPYHDLVGEMLDMLEFIFKYGDHPDFHVEVWSLGEQLAALEQSPNKGHKHLASALRSAFEYGALKNVSSIHLFKWKDEVVGGSSPISLVYTSANLRTDLDGIPFTGDGANLLFHDSAVPLHRRDKAFREYLYRLRYSSLNGLTADNPLSQLAKYIQDSGANYDSQLDREVRVNPGAFKNIEKLQSGGADVQISGVQLYHSDHRLEINENTCDYLLAPTVEIYKNGHPVTKVPMALTKYGVSGLKYVGREWNPNTDRIPQTLPADLDDRSLPGFGQKDKYPYLTVSDFLEDKIIEVSYDIDKEKFFTGCAKQITFLLPLKKKFFEYFSLKDLVDVETGKYTDMLTVSHDEDHSKLTVQLDLPLVHGRKIRFLKTYDTSEKSLDKLDCYDSSNTFDFAIFPFYRLSPDVNHNVYNVMLGSNINGITCDFYEPSNRDGNARVEVEAKHRSRKSKNSNISSDHIRVPGAFTYMEISVPDGEKTVNALAIPLFPIVNSDRTLAAKEFVFSIDFGTTNTHVSYANITPGSPIGEVDVHTFKYDNSDSQIVTFNNKEGAREFGAFSTMLKREMVPPVLGENIKFPMRTATYQVTGNPPVLEMFFNTNIGFNYGEDISRSSDYKTNIKWDRFDGHANERMSTFFAQMLWMMKNKSVLNDCTDKFKLIVTYPISMGANDLNSFKQAWTDAIKTVQCDVDIRYRTESIAPYYSYIAGLNAVAPYVNVDIGGGTTDILYVNPLTDEASVFSAFFAANDLWNDGIELANRSSKANGFVSFFRGVQLGVLGEKRTDVESVIQQATSSADIISYLFSNDNWTRLSHTIRRSPIMMQLPVIHFSAIAFYIAYSLHTAEMEIPKYLSFTGMGSKYVKLISGADEDISKLVNAIFHYAGKVLDDPTLETAEIKVSFAPNPKEVTASGALISLNFKDGITPSEDIYYGYEEEDTSVTIRYNNITADVQDSVMRLFRKFAGAFEDAEVMDVLSDIGYSVDSEVIGRLKDAGFSSFWKIVKNRPNGTRDTDKLKEPMFFWPLKNSLYLIGKELSTNAVNELQNN